MADQNTEKRKQKEGCKVAFISGEERCGQHAR